MSYINSSIFINLTRETNVTGLGKQMSLIYLLKRVYFIFISHRKKCSVGHRKKSSAILFIKKIYFIFISQQSKKYNIHIRYTHIIYI